MNWMGGNLSRHRRGKGWKEEMARQKEYFAKARSRQREGAKSSPVPLSAANFIPNYAPPPQATASLGEATFPSSMPISEPTGAADEASRSLNNPLRPLRGDVTELPLIASSGETGGFTVPDQSLENHPMGASNQRTERRKTFQEGDVAKVKLPKLSVKEPTRQIFERPPLSRHILDQQHRTSVARREFRSKFDKQRGVRERRVTQNTPPPSLRSVRISIGSRDFRWSEERNSIQNAIPDAIGNPTFGDHSEAQSIGPEAEQTTHTTRLGGANIASYITGESFTGCSLPSTSSDLLLSSPCRDRAARRQNMYNSPKKIVGAPSAEFEHPLLDYAYGAAKKPSSTSETESTGSVAVQIGDFEITPEGETDEERVWRQWLG
ncbi:hypothetical protein CI102_7816 [Trichoderma harzianum]|uniref:Uncharacterized protein n=1 Tax=Trichoderma harzianum CBS 226.95 TaxID=983964 RepID=A0A2T4AC08_TRIHA|nr:hypothetical protein M431DRAFT_519919 [Trichoderma harzianum CBS 226.95]PKK47001.1 hypothetical protein CI102_7816 [Trichoderma harzianum]PTB54614.1 hypothetical protein M431DRAFT_519919 [Trichoderma harzianum CBS 226.95]